MWIYEIKRKDTSFFTIEFINSFKDYYIKESQELY